MIRSRYQFWFFIYSTGNPIVYSAATLRRALAEVLEQHDPEGADPALKRMVIVGHSQGGLLTRLMGITVDVDAVCTEVLGAPLAELGLDEQQEALLRECFDIQPAALRRAPRVPGHAPPRQLPGRALVLAPVREPDRRARRDRIVDGPDRREPCRASAFHPGWRSASRPASTTWIRTTRS